MTTLSRQDIQSLLDNTRNQILQRGVNRQDYQILLDQVRALTNLVQQNQQIIRQSEYQRVQMMRHMGALESRLVQMDQEMRLLRASHDKLVERQPERVMMPTQTESAQSPEQRYLYRPA